MLLNKRARKTIGKTAVKVGGAAAIAGVGYFAYQKWQQSKQAPSTTSNHPQANPALAAVPTQPAAPAQLAAPVSESLAAVMLKAMIASALADNQLQPEQFEQIEAAMDNPVLTPDEVRTLTAALHHPPTIEEIAAAVDGLEQASEVYGACLSVIDPDNMAENMFLRRMARALALPDALARSIREQAGLTA
jgi:uncharacterized membrane protein YebE (DUF533 family)